MFTDKKKCDELWDTTAYSILTNTQSMHTLSLFHETVNFVHLGYRGLRPALLLDNRFHFLTKIFDVLRIGCQVVERMSKSLEKFRC